MEALQKIWCYIGDIAVKTAFSQNGSCKRFDDIAVRAVQFSLKMEAFKDSIAT